MNEHPTRTNFATFIAMQMIIYLVVGVGAAVFMAFAPIVRDAPAVAVGRGFIMAMLSGTASMVLLWSGRKYVPAFFPEQIDTSLKIFRNFDTLLLSMLYIMTFSSFLGYANTFPKLINAMYPQVTASDFTWMPALLGSLARIVGGTLADKFSGAYLPAFVTMHAILFMATGFGNGTVFRQIAALIEPGTRGEMLGWTATIGAFGGAIFPTFFDLGINAGVNDLMYYVISGYDGLCMFINWRYCFWLGKPV